LRAVISGAASRYSVVDDIVRSTMQAGDGDD